MVTVFFSLRLPNPTCHIWRNFLAQRVIRPVRLANSMFFHRVTDFDLRKYWFMKKGGPSWGVRTTGTSGFLTAVLQARDMHMVCQTIPTNSGLGTYPRIVTQPCGRRVRCVA